jgi:hypothetical protein
MPTYVHYNRCSCVDWGHGKWVTENSVSNSPGFAQKNHWRLDGDSRCLTYLRFDHTVVVPDPVAVTPGNTEEGIQRVLKFARTTTSSTVAVMWDFETHPWYKGKSNHRRFQGNIPNHIFSCIEGLPTDNGNWAFGWNCAEIECIVQAYNQENSIDLSGCLFIAANTGKLRLYGGCRTCKNWITHFKGNSHLPKL